jgi:hypothetical protein
MLVVLVRHQVSSSPTVPSSATEEEELLWANGAIHEIYNWLNCTDHHTHEEGNHPRAPNEATWRLLHETYERILPKSTALPPSDQERTSGYHFTVALRKTERDNELVGIYTTEAISKGTLVWESTYTAHFDTGDEFRAFARALPTPLACNVLLSAFPRYLDDEPVICVDLDYSSLMGICDEEEECNLHLAPDEDHSSSGCHMEFYASRDIAAGELLLVDHDDTEDIEGLLGLGLAYEGQLPDYDDGEL